jgi:hypothetical protein
MLILIEEMALSSATDDERLLDIDLLILKSESQVHLKASSLPLDKFPQCDVNIDLCCMNLVISCSHKRRFDAAVSDIMLIVSTK